MGVVETLTGYHIFKLLSKKEGVKQTIAPYESVRMEIQDMAPAMRQSMSDICNG